jgi:hypothetical protein
MQIDIHIGLLTKGFVKHTAMEWLLPTIEKSDIMGIAV